MNLDIRLPIGLLFAILGGLLVLYGLWTHFSNPNMYDRSLGLNINLWWGIVMSFFGAFMIWLGRRGATEIPDQAH
ncbi:hypothetical protein [Aquisphaera insulae]|uniref:hypothetical protein n=1 Tax=Aquisphaera insulae TaxID=2712864 RepID=UPI0013EBDA44|nr:hypothetical protein [Aquisphaera insulae]